LVVSYILGARGSAFFVRPLELHSCFYDGDVFTQMFRHFGGNHSDAAFSHPECWVPVVDKRQAVGIGHHDEAFLVPRPWPNKALETIGVGRFIFIHKRFLVAGHRRSPMSQLFSLGIITRTTHL